MGHGSIMETSGVDKLGPEESGISCVTCILF